MELHRYGGGPHIHGEESVRSILLSFLVALAPALVWGVYAFGTRALVILLLAALSAVISEALVRLIMKKRGAPEYLSSVITSLLLAMNLPVSVPLWMVPLGVFFAVGILSCLLGRYLRFFVNPVPTVKLILLGIFPVAMTRFAAPFSSLDPFSLSGKVSEESLVSPVSPEAFARGEESLSFLRLASGYGAGGIGEVSGTLLLAGLLYLLVRRIVTWHVPVVFIGTVFLLAFLFPQGDGSRFAYCAAFLFSGPVLLGAVFIATHYATCPVTSWGKVIYAALCGILTVVFRSFLGAGAGVCLAIFVSDLLSFLPDFFLIPTPYGAKRRFDIGKYLSPLLKKAASLWKKVKEKSKK